MKTTYKPLEHLEVLELFIYKDEHFRWVFDDEENGLAQEAFVDGMDDVIDLLTKDLPDHGYDGDWCCVRQYFGGEKDAIELTHYEELRHSTQGTSNYYWCQELNKKVWLCNNLYKYVDHTPQVLWCWLKK